MSSTMIYEIEDLKLDNASLVLNETIFHNANGYIGIRSCFEEGYQSSCDSIRGSYINGFFDYAPMKQAEKLFGLAEEKQTMLNVADTSKILLMVDGETFQMFEGTVLKSSRTLNMEEGYTKRTIVWRSPHGKEIEVVIKRMTSFYQRSLFLIEYRVTPLNFSGEIGIESFHSGEVMNYCNPDDPRVAGESFVHLKTLSVDITDSISYITSKTTTSELYVSTGVYNCFLKEGKERILKEGNGVKLGYSADLTSGETCVLYKYSVFTDSIRYPDSKRAAAEQMERALTMTVEELYKKQREHMDKFWNQSYLEIDGDDELTLAVRYNLYQLMQSAGRDAYSNIAAKGLSGEGYEGHYFWDTEMYIQPFFTLTNPEISKSLIEYRYRILEEARANAVLMGHKKGALFPWRTIMGRECSGYFPSGSAQYHINGDIAYSITAYYLATDDLAFIEEIGAEIIFETARLFADAGNYYGGVFHINEVTGPDEYTCLVNNNYYTNVSAQYNFHWAVRFYELLKEKRGVCKSAEKIKLTESEINEFVLMEKNMFLPYDKSLKINPQDDSFLQKPIWDIEGTPRDKFPLLLHYHPLVLYRHQVCKQADTVLAHFIFEDAQSFETIRNSFEYYEKVTTHDSSLSTCIYSIVASKLGLEEKAYRYFGDSAKLDLFDTHNNTKDGIHTANMGGSYMAIVYGFGGLRLKESGLYLSPALPREWNGYKFRINYHSSQILVEVDKLGCSIQLCRGDHVELYLYNKKYALYKTPIRISKKLDK